MAQINKYNDHIPIAVLRSELSAPALKIFMQNPQLRKSNDPDFIEKEFAAFFSPPSKTTATVELDRPQTVAASATPSAF